MPSFWAVVVQTVNEIITQFLNSVVLFYDSCYIQLILHQPITTFSRSLQNGLTREFSPKRNEIQESAEDLFTSKLAEFFSKCNEELPAKWQEHIANNGGYITELNVNILNDLVNKIDEKKKTKLFITQLIYEKEKCL